MNNKRDRQVVQQGIHVLVQIFEAYPMLRLAQHLEYIMSKEGAYHWSNERLLHELDKYKDKLEEEHDDIVEPEGLEFD